MEAHNTQTARKRVYTDLSNPNNPLVTTSTINGAWSDVVLRSATVQGDRKKPTAFSYTATTQDTYYEGVYDEYLNGKLYTHSVGTLNLLSTGGLFNRVNNMLSDMTNYHYNRALDRLNEKVRGQLDHSVNATQLSQMKRMATGIGKIDNYLGNTLRKLGHKRAGFAGTLKNLVKDAGDNWLQWQYGFRPLVQDIYDTATELHRHATDGLIQVSASSKAIIGNQKLTGSPYPQLNTIAAVEGLVGVRFAITLKDPGGFDLSRWASLNPVSIGWEMLPYSFVVDWLYDIGGMLRSLETSLLYGSRFVSGYYTTLYAHSGQHRVNGFAKVGAYNTWLDAGSGYKYVKFARVPLGSYPGPKMPTFKIQLGSERLLSAAALLAQHLVGVKGDSYKRIKTLV